MDVSTELRTLLTRGGMSQAKLARRAGVSQPTVSRAMRRAPRRNSQSYTRLCSYIHKELGEVGLPGPACDALAEIWDGSLGHAEALAALIRAAGDVGRTGGTKGQP